MSEIEKKEPWEFEKDDFEKSDPLYEITRPYRIWHEYLRLSPTFLLAAKEHEYQIENLSTADRKRSQEGLMQFSSCDREILAKRKITIEEENRKPDDYAEVVNTFKQMAYGGWEFSNLSFRKWWLIQGADIFGHRHAPSPVSLFNVPHHSDLNKDEFNQVLDTYLNGQRKEDGMTGFALFAIPLSGDRKKILSALKDLINEDDITPIKKSGEALFQLQKGKQLAKLPKGLRLLFMRAMNPELELWRLGHMAGVSDKEDYVNLDPTLKHHTYKTQELSVNLGRMTLGNLKDAVIIMENAARGRFPCNDASLLPEFDQDEIIAQLKDSLKLREQQEKSRLRIINFRRKKT
jgi:hypothetical protein